jgi:hypothetical protein
MENETLKRVISFIGKFLETAFWGAVSVALVWLFSLIVLFIADFNFGKADFINALTKFRFPIAGFTVISIISALIAKIMVFTLKLQQSQKGLVFGLIQFCSIFFFYVYGFSASLSGVCSGSFLERLICVFDYTTRTEFYFSLLILIGFVGCASLFTKVGNQFKAQKSLD